MDYHKEKASNVVSYDDTDIDEFFSLSDEVEPFELSENTGNQVFFNELDQLIYAVGTRREYYIFFLLCEGNTTYFSYYVKGNLWMKLQRYSI